MKARYKITLAFMLLAIIVLAAICAFVYYSIADRQRNEFDSRLQNRAITIGFFLNKLPPDDFFKLLTQLNSVTTNMLASENINIYNIRNQRIYRFAKNLQDTVNMDAAFLNRVRVEGKLHTKVGQKRLAALYLPHAESPVIIVISAIDENGIAHLHELQKNLVIAFFAGIFLSFLSGWFFSKQLLKPISAITEKVNNISATNIEARLPVSNIEDEWNQLAITFNDLFSRLQQSFEMQGRFISNASHELSTPLTSVTNQIDVILNKPRTNDEYLAVLQSVKADVYHMTALTRQLLSLARSARGGTIHSEAVRIDEILMETPLLLKKLSAGYLVNIYFDELPDNEKFCTVNGSYELLLSAFKNIAENGCKYSTDHIVNISLSFVANKIIVLFSNKSIAVGEDELEDIFQPFQRGVNTLNEKGYGLGLSLTRRIILLHKGEIKAEIPEPGQFLVTVILPSCL